MLKLTILTMTAKLKLTICNMTHSRHAKTDEFDHDTCVVRITPSDCIRREEHARNKRSTRRGLKAGRRMHASKCPGVCEQLVKLLVRIDPVKAQRPARFILTRERYS
jgi:hypothetical protein